MAAGVIAVVVVAAGGIAGGIAIVDAVTLNNARSHYKVELASFRKAQLTDSSQAASAAATAKAAGIVSTDAAGIVTASNGFVAAAQRSALNTAQSALATDLRQKPIPGPSLDAPYNTPRTVMEFNTSGKRLATDSSIIKEHAAQIGSRTRIIASAAKVVSTDLDQVAATVSTTSKTVLAVDTEAPAAAQSAFSNAAAAIAKLPPGADKVKPLSAYFSAGAALQQAHAAAQAAAAQAAAAQAAAQAQAQAAEDTADSDQSSDSSSDDDASSSGDDGFVPVVPTPSPGFTDPPKLCLIYDSCASGSGQ
jgi:hypothetical protein